MDQKAEQTRAMSLGHNGFMHRSVSVKRRTDGQKHRRTMTGKKEEKRTYFGAPSRKGGVGFGRGRSKQCVPVVRQTHLLSLSGRSDGTKGDKKQGEEVNEVYVRKRLSSGGEVMTRCPRAAEEEEEEVLFTFREEITALWLSLSGTSSKKGCRLGGAVTGRPGCGTPLVSK